MGLLQLLVVQCFLLGANAVTTVPPNSTALPDVQIEGTSLKPPEQELNISSCHSDEDIGSRFVLQRGFKTWFEALAACARQGTRLAVPRSPQEAAALGAKIFAAASADPPPASADVMVDAISVGIHNIDPSGHWRTLDGSLLSEAGYDLWLDGGEGECGALLGDGRYVRQPCYTRMRFACEVSRANAASAKRQLAGYEEVAEAGAGRFRLYEQPLAWALARRRCEAEGAALAVPSSARQAGLLAGVLFTRARANARLQRQGFFVGATDVVAEGQWRTVQGSSLNAAGYSTWKFGEPSGGRRRNCAVLLRDGRYADHSCTAPAAYCCQEVDATHSEDLVKTRGRYRLHQTPLSWFDAVLACQRENGTLVTPLSRERELVKNMMYSDERDLYGNRVIDVPWIHAAIYDSFGNQTWKSVNDESQPQMENILWKRKGLHSREFHEYESSERHDYNDYGNDRDIEEYRVTNGYQHIPASGKCVKMDHSGDFRIQNCVEKLPYVCKRTE